MNDAGPYVLVPLTVAVGALPRESTLPVARAEEGERDRPARGVRVAGSGAEVDDRAVGFGAVPVRRAVSVTALPSARRPPP